MAANAPNLIDYRLNLGPGAGPERGPVSIIFTGYADSVGGSPLWSESHSPVANQDGNVRLSLGSVTPIPPALMARSRFWIEVKVRGKVLPARRKIELVQMPEESRNMPPERLPDGKVRLALIDFGQLKHEAPHHVALGATDRSPSFGWLGGPVRTLTRPLENGLYYSDFVEGHDASFVIAVDASVSPYRITLTLGDTDSGRKPVDVLVGDKVVSQAPATKAGEFAKVTVNVKAQAERITFRLRGQECDLWALVGLDLYGQPGARLGNLYPPKKRDNPVPPSDQLMLQARVDPRAVLRSYCRFLMSERLSDGSFNSSGAWYANAYPIRTLLAGSIVLNEPSWRRAAFECLDRFVREQKADGNWHSAYFGPTQCSLAKPDGSSANLADVGCMSLCLALAAPMADEHRQKKYLAAATRYADRVVLPAQLPTGAFPNGLYAGKVYRHPYSVATATQAASLAALGAVTRNQRYSDAADKAAIWLAEQFQPDGSVHFAPHDNDQMRILLPNSFGDVFYLVESLTWTERLGRQSDAKRASRLALERYLWGPNGLKSTAQSGYWWKPGNPWSDSKMGGVLYILTEMQRWSEPGTLDEWIPQALAWLAKPELSRQIGVMAPLPSKTGLYGMTATGFAGIGVANLIDPDIFRVPSTNRDALGLVGRSASKSD